MTDHANLQWLTTIAPQQAKVARWCMSMAEFDFYIEHRSGTTNVVPDVLSRYPVTKVPDCSLVTLPDHKIESFFLLALSVDVPTHTTQEVTDTLSPTVIYMSSAFLLTHPTCASPISARGHDSNTDTAMEKPQENLTNDKPTYSNSNTLPTLDPTELKHLNPQRAAFDELQQKDYWCKNLIKYLSSSEKKASIAHLPTKHQQWIKQMSNRTGVQDDLLMYRDEFMVNPSHYRIMVPNDIELRHKLLQAYHDSPLAMQRGRDATFEALSYDYYWRGVAKQVKNWIRRCPQCIRFRTPVPKPGPMQVHLYQSPFYTIGIDYVGPLPETPSGNKWIITTVCPYSNFLVAIPGPDKRATTAARALFDHVFLQYGFPAELLSEVVNGLMQWYSSSPNYFPIDHVFTTSYRPRLNGATERVHRWLNSAIAIYCDELQTNWQDFLQPAVYTHNVSPIPGMDKLSPFFLVFGRHAPAPETLTLDLPSKPLSQQTCGKPGFKIIRCQETV